MRIGYFADGPWAHQAIDGILSNNQIKISFICLRYEKPDSFLRSVALAHNIPCLVQKNVNCDSFISALREYNCDLFVSIIQSNIGSSIRNIIHWEL